MPDIFVSDKDKLANRERSVVPKSPKEGSVGAEVRKKRKHNPLSAYCYRPRGVDFETRERSEKIILLLRRHPITNIGWLVVALAMLITPFVLPYFPLLDFLPKNFQFIAVLGWYLVTTAFVLENFLTWFFNVNIITDERIIDIDFYNLIYKEVSDAKIDKVQDVTYKMGGAIRTVFNYGDVFIQTAAEVPAFEFLAVPKPDRVARLLQDLIIEEEKEKIEGRVR